MSRIRTQEFHLLDGTRLVQYAGLNTPLFKPKEIICLLYPAKEPDCKLLLCEFRKGRVYFRPSTLQEKVVWKRYRSEVTALLCNYYKASH